MRRRRLFKFLKGLGLALLTLVLLLGFIYLLPPKGPRATMPFDDPHVVDRPAATSDHFMAATGNPWTTQAALQVMQDGGNAVDAAVASLLVLNVTFCAAASFPGVAPVLVYDAQHNAVESYIGAGTAPAKTTIESFKARGWDNRARDEYLVAAAARLAGCHYRPAGEVRHEIVHRAERPRHPHCERRLPGA